MALNIIHQDITEVIADAVVNSTNEHLTVGGLGVDASIHYAAGPELDAALAGIGFCPTGSAVITESFNLKTCRYIIHTVGPVYSGGSKAERETAKKLLEQSYRSALRLAVENDCRSIAFPLISAGAYAFPKVTAYRIATHTIREWMSRHDCTDLDVSLVLFDLDVIEISRRMDSALLGNTSFNFQEIRDKRERLKAYFAAEANEFRTNRRTRSGQIHPQYAAEAASCPPAAALRETDLDYEAQDLSFGEMCEWWCEKKNIRKSQFLSDSNITRATFSNIRLHPDHPPKKTTVMACAIGLKLDIDQARDLLMRAGMTFSRHFPTDWLVEQYIRRGVYDIDQINFELYQMDLKLLGYSKGE